jgi:hypothetical protein
LVFFFGLTPADINDSEHHSVKRWDAMAGKEEVFVGDHGARCDGKVATNEQKYEEEMVLGQGRRSLFQRDGSQMAYQDRRPNRWRVSSIEDTAALSIFLLIFLVLVLPFFSFSRHIKRTKGTPHDANVAGCSSWEA